MTENPVAIENVKVGPPPSSHARRWAWGVAVVVLGLVVIGYAVRPWYLSWRGNWGVVVPGKIFRSAELSRVILADKLQKNKIATIIYLSRDGENNANMANERQVASDLGIPILNFPMEGDGTTQHPEYYTATIAAMVDANAHSKPVLVHCHSGAQRTGGVVAVYRVLVEGKTAQEAVAEMLHYRHDPKKNPALIPFLNTHIGEWAQDLVRRGIIVKVPSPLPRFAAE